MINGIKIVTRLCKEIGIFPSKYYLNIINFIKENNSYVFYGLDGGDYSRIGVEYEIMFLKLQFDIIKSLIDNNLLEIKDYHTIMYDTLQRYSLKLSINTTWFEDWKKIVEKTNKKEFVEYFFNKFEEKVGKIPEECKNNIYYNEYYTIH